MRYRGRDTNELPFSAAASPAPRRHGTMGFYLLAGSTTAYWKARKAAERAIERAGEAKALSAA
ncbi:hypothetical protein GGE45_002646 [Rhizobium aethiopicum]|uniref:Uncharacterized protein n=1 Tax=Rhizobium aethiopicum TaxID=1138170 RepID=A0A7W6Q5E8_9HYPH|nr:hypothetical protein [Rhizobium aethiopicum]MBB4580316.1 hypothetical protein [Rhizobium aethiopicum]